MSQQHSELNVLLVDDNPDDVFMLKKAFAEAEEPVAIETAPDGAAALDYLKTCAQGNAAAPGIVLLDLNMPGIDGFEFLSRIREQQPGIGVIIMTAFPERHTRTQAMRAGADGYIQKPFSLSKFSTVLERAYWNALTRADSLGFEQAL